MRRNLYHIATAFFASGVLLAGCKKFADPGVIIEEYTPDTTMKAASNQRKLLLINIDGLAANVLQAVKPTTLQGMLQNAKYSFNTTVNVPVNNTASFGSMFTGNFETRLWDSTFYAVPVDSSSAIPVPLNLTAFRYIHDVLPSKKFAAVADWPNLVTTLLADADKKVVTSGDVETKTNVETILKSGSIDVIFARFSSVQKAGKQFGYAAGAEYEAAIRTVDGYIGEIMTTLKSRPTFKDEKWLTLVTTTQVSDSLMKSKDSNAKIPGFLIAHYPGFTGQDITKLNPAILAKNEDVTPMMLYWLSVSKPSTVANGANWIDRFELEFFTK